jgi:hypothetical protein
MSEKNKTFFFIGFIFLIITVLTAFTSSLPDGLEWVLHRFGIEGEEAPFFEAPAADYTLHDGLPESINRVISAILGMTIIFFIFFIWLKWRQKRQKKDVGNNET